jgi:hypothetical protein|tara:strand:+ start:160 stop:399 length:240 start_codon:yes stop_codon:yes gene_type:complete
MSLGNGVFGAYRHLFEIDISFLIVLETVADDPSGCLLKFACSTGLAGFEWEDISKAWKRRVSLSRFLNGKPGFFFRNRK